jgi:hypothetical protein
MLVYLRICVALDYIPRAVDYLAKQLQTTVMQARAYYESIFNGMFDLVGVHEGSFRIQLKKIGQNCKATGVKAVLGCFEDFRNQITARNLNWDQHVLLFYL